jgi:cystathionine beta-lyase/cystathionine gamma-synthase
MKSDNGLKTLAEAGLSPELLRLSVGMEEPDQIIEALKDALAAT